MARGSPTARPRSCTSCRSSPSGELPDSSDDIVTLPLTGDWVQQPGFNANGIAETPDHKALLVIQSVDRDAVPRRPGDR